MAVDRTNTIQILYSTGTDDPSTAGLTLGKGELAWADHGSGGANGRLYIGDSATGAQKWIAGIGTGVAAAAAGDLTGATLAGDVLASSLTSLGTIASLTATAANVIVAGSATNTVARPLTITHNTSGTEAAGFGTGLAFKGTVADGDDQTFGAIDAVATAVGAGAEDMDLVFSVADGGTVEEVMRVTSAGVLTLDGHTVANWDTAYGWGDHGSAGYGTSSLTLGTGSGNAMAGNVLSAQDKTDIGNLSGTNSGDQTLTGLSQYLASDAADTMSVSGAGLTISDINGTGSGSTGGFIRLQMNDGALLADNNRLGVIEFAGAEDGSATFSVGARIEAIARSAWDGSNNDADLVFYTTDGTTQSAALTLDADNDATFTGGINMAAKSIVMTPSTNDTITFAAAANGALTITTVDTAADAADVAWVIDGSMSWAAHSGMDLSTAGVITNATLAGGTF